MLVLSRKKNETIHIGDNIQVTVVEIAPGKVRLGIKAPPDVRVDREEVRRKLPQAPNVPAAPTGS